MATLLSLCIIAATAQAVSTLAPGDIAIIAYNADGSEDFSFIPLVDIDAGVSFTFNEDGPDTVTYTTPAGGLAKGTVVVILTPKTTPSATVGSVTFAGDWGWSSSGDSIEAFQGGTYLYSVDTKASYTLRPGLSFDDNTAVSHQDNSDTGYYSGTRSGTQSNLLIEIAAPANWTYLDTGADDFIAFNVAPHNVDFTVLNEEPPTPPPSGSGPTQSISLVQEGWRFDPAQFGNFFYNGVTLSNPNPSGSVLPFIRDDDGDALDKICVADNTGSILQKGWFSVYFTNDIPQDIVLTSVELHIHHQGDAGQSGHFNVHISDDRTVTRWFASLRTVCPTVSSNILWDATETQTVLDLTTLLSTPSQITNAEFAVVNSATSSDDVYFDYMKFVVEYSANGLPVLTNTAPTSVDSTSADLNVSLTAATPIATLWMYWGDNDGEETVGNWDNVISLGAQSAGDYLTHISGLTPNSTYYYRSFASNTLGTAWAGATVPFTTLSPEIRFTASTNNVQESAGTVTLNVELTGASAQPASVTISATGGTAVNGADYNYSNGNVVIAAGQTTTSATFTVTQDTKDEFNETIEFTLSGVVGASIGSPSTHIVSIIDDDAPPSIEFLRSPSNNLESAGLATMELVLSDDSGKPVTIDFFTSNGTAIAGSDYTETTGTVSWAADSSAAETISVILENDGDAEGNETFAIVLHSPLHATIGSPAIGTVNLVDDDAGPPIVNNDEGPSSISSNSATLRSALDSAGGAITHAWIYWDTVDRGTTTVGWASSAFISNIAVGDFTVNAPALLQNTSYTYRTQASNQFGTVWAPTAATFVTGPPELNFNASELAQSESMTTVAISLSINAPNAYAHPITFDVVRTGGTATPTTDFTLLSSSVTLNAGDTTTNIYLSVVDDQIDELDETIIIELTQADFATLGATTTHTYTIEDDEALPDLAFSETSYTFDETAGLAIIRIAPDVPSGLDVSADYTTLDGSAKKDVDYLTRSGTLFWPAGTFDTKTFTVPIVNNTLSEGDRFLQISLSAVSNATTLGGSTVDITIEEDDIAIPQVSNADGATDIRSRLAMLNALVLSGVPAPTVTIYWGTSDGGTTPGTWQNTLSLGIQSLAAAGEITGLASNTTYFYRAHVSNASGESWAPSTTNFTTTAAQDYFVNDASQNNDQFCDAIGNDANSGKDPAAPKANLKSIIDTYDIGPGDTIWVDTGNYTLAATVTFTSADLGAEGATILVRGSPHPAGAHLVPASAFSDAIEVNVAGDAYLRLEGLYLNNAQRGIYIHGTASTDCRSVEIINCTSSDNLIFGQGGIHIERCRDITIKNCSVNNNGLAGIYLLHCTDLTLENNSCSGNFSYGIYGQFCTRPILIDNQCFDQDQPGTGHGIWLAFGNNEVLENNECYDNTTSGITIDGESPTLINNTIHDNGSDGVKLTGGGITFTGNTIHNNGGHGLTTLANNGLTATHNIFYNNGGYHLRLTSSSVKAHLEFNTLYGGKGFYIAHPAYVTNQHNTIWATGSGNYGIEVDDLPNFGGGEDMVSDYNNLYATSSAQAGKWAAQTCIAMAAWQVVTLKDPNSLGLNPHYVSTTSPHDYHLQSKKGSWHDGLWQEDLLTSPCIDAGHPDAEFVNESTYHGLRVNIGAYGNMPQSSRTDYDGPLFALAGSITPTAAGTYSASPPSPVYPTNVVITLSTTLTNASYRWDRWSADLNGNTNQTLQLMMTNDIIAQAVYLILFSNTNGVPDSWFIEHGLTPSQESADTDTDFDGHLNWQEFYTGTIPTNTLSVLQVDDMAMPVIDRLSFHFPSVIAIRYRVESSPSLINPTWTPEPASTTPGGSLSSSPINGTGATLTIEVAFLGAARVYRITTLP